MGRSTRWSIVAGLAGLLVVISMARADRGAVAAQSRKAVFVTRLYTGPDGQTHAEEVESSWTANNVSQLMKITGGELHRAAPGTVQDWHNAPRRQYVITLSGHGEIEVAGGKKIPVAPGHIELAEDLTGKGHITRVVGSEDRVTLQLPLVEQPAR